MTENLTEEQIEANRENRINSLTLTPYQSQEIMNISIKELDNFIKEYFQV